jgi:hypothetical protein
MRVICGRWIEMPEIGSGGLTSAEVQALIDASLPWLISIDVFATAKSNVNWNINTNNSKQDYSALRSGGDDPTTEIAWDVVLGAGTWAIELNHVGGPNKGIYHIQFDGVEKATIDGYRASETFKIRESVTGIIVPVTKKIELKIIMATQNPLSSGYQCAISAIRLMRTA